MYFKQIEEIVDGTKRQTRRVCKPSLCDADSLLLDGEVALDIDRQLVISHLGERGSDRVIHSVHTVHNRKSRLKWHVYGDYAVSPGRGKCGLWWHPETGAVKPPTESLRLYRVDSVGGVADGWQPLRIRLLEIRREPLHHISVADAVAEGYPHEWPPDPMAAYVPEFHPDPVAWYRALWESINGRGSWDKNPDVWCLTFEVVRS